MSQSLSAFYVKESTCIAERSPSAPVYSSLLHSDLPLFAIFHGICSGSL